MLTEPACSIADELGGRAGSTAVMCCISPMFITTANVGDSRAVLCRNGIAIDLSQDHKPTAPAELVRITKAGGWVGQTGRINGKLAVSRAIGDFAYKQNRSVPREEQVVSGTPDVRVVERRGDDEFLLIACDGVWDVISSQDAVNLVRSCLGKRRRAWRRVMNHQMELSAIVETLFDNCVSSSDNLTAILVLFEDSPEIVERELTEPTQHDSVDEVEQSDDDVMPSPRAHVINAHRPCF